MTEREILNKAWFDLAATIIAGVMQGSERDCTHLLDGLPEEISIRLSLIEDENVETQLAQWLSVLDEVDRQALVGDTVWGYKFFENAITCVNNATLLPQLRGLQSDYYRRFC